MPYRPPLALLLGCTLPAWPEEVAPSRDDVIAAMKPYDGPTIPGVNRSTLAGKVRLPGLVHHGGAK
jgi:hypothetical protein